MGKFSAEKVMTLLDFRGKKQLANALRQCWFEQDFHDIDSFDSFAPANLSVFSIRIHAPLETYEYLRNLGNAQNDQLLAVFKEIYSSKEDHVAGIGFELEVDEEVNEQLISTVEEQKSLMIAVATGQQRIQEVNDQYKMRKAEIAKALQGRGINDPNRFVDLWAWYSRWKSGDLPSYQSIRQFVSELYDPLLQQLQSTSSPTPGIFAEPTGWARVDRCVTQIRDQLEQASNEEQFQVVGTLCREALISLAQAVFEPTRHPTLDGVKTSSTDFKRMMEAYFAVELAGESMRHSRQHAKAAFDLANELQHKRTATFRHAALCAEATTAVVNFVAIVSGQRDP